MDEHTISPAGDPFHAAPHDQDERPCACYSGWVFVGYIDEDGEEREISYKCRRCTKRGGEMDGAELKKRRKAQGLGQRALAKASGVPQQVISAAENGRVELPRGAARKLEEALAS